MSRDPQLYLDELIEAAERAMRFGQNLERSDYQPGAMAYEAILRQIEVIGEAAAHLPPQVRLMSPEIPWENLIGMRNRLIHGYFAIDPDIVFDVVRNKLPVLLTAAQRLSDQLS